MRLLLMMLLILTLESRPFLPYQKREKELVDCSNVIIYGAQISRLMCTIPIFFFFFLFLCLLCGKFKMQYLDLTSHSCRKIEQQTTVLANF